MYLPYLFLCISLFVRLIVAQDAEDDTTWTTVTLEDASIGATDSDKAVAIAYEGSSFIVAVERKSPNTASATPVLYKVSSSGEVLWTFEAQALSGTPFDIAVNQNQGTAYLVLSSMGVDSPYTSGHIIRYSGISEAFVSTDVQNVVSEDIFFTTDSVLGNTKLFGCVLDPLNGDLFVTGGTSASLYGRSNGKSDVIVIRISSSGQVLATTQFGSVANEFGRAIDISADSTVVAVAVQKILENGGSESLLYRLDATTLSDSEGPQTLLSYAATPLFTPTDVAISGPLVSEPGTITTVITGSALTVPDRKADMFFHVFAKIGESESNVAVYVDGVADRKNYDYAIGLRAGTDGNLYSIGYSSSSEESLTSSLSLVVVSPTGETIYRHGGTPISNTVPEEAAMAMTLFSENSTIIVAFVGCVRLGMAKRATLGLAIPPPGKIPVFEGFGSVVEGAEAGSPSSPSPSSDRDRKSGLGIIPITTGTLAGVLVLLLGGLAITFFRKQQGRPVPATHLDDGSKSIASLNGINDTAIRPPHASSAERSSQQQNSTLV